MKRMTPKTLIVTAAHFLAGTLTGARLARWQFANQWDQWILHVNLQPLMAEQTFGIKQLRQGDAANLEVTLEASIWRNIALLDQQKKGGKPLPLQAGKDLQFHCAYNLKHPDSVSAPIAAQRV